MKVEINRTQIVTETLDVEFPIYYKDLTCDSFYTYGRIDKDKHTQLIVHDSWSGFNYEVEVVEYDEMNILIDSGLYKYMINSGHYLSSPEEFNLILDRIKQRLNTI